MTRRLAWLLVPLLLGLGPGTGPGVLAAPESVREYELKAAYVYNFAKFTRWPGAGESGVPSPIVIGVLGNERVAEAIAALTRGRTVSGSAIEVKAFGANDIPATLHIVYIGESQDGSLPRLAPVLFQPGRLTIGETEAFTQHGGIIRLFVEADRLRFEIDNAHAQKAGLTLSSQLLMLARKVTNAN
jgi:hypothetical protein